MRVLMVTFPFPPMSGTSGVQRPSKFAQFLAEAGVHVDVLTCHPRAYASRTAEAAAPPPGVTVSRATCIDAGRHLSIGGRYPRFLALPDRWASWIPFGVAKGLGMIRSARPDVIWSTYPIASAHLIAASLARISGLPWVADFRDPMIEDEYQDGQYDSLQASSMRFIENLTARMARYCVCTTPGTRALYQSRYAGYGRDKWVVIPNGYDEDDFAAVPPPPASSAMNRPFRLLHSGTIYSSERDPRPLFAALGRLQTKGVLSAETFRLVLRSPGNEALLNAQLEQAGCSSLVDILPGVSHRAAVEEMLNADGLLVLQAANCNRQIPAKAYEYIRSGRPILALTDPIGDTAGLLKDVPAAQLGTLANANEIEGVLPRFLESARIVAGAKPDVEWARMYSRRTQAEVLHALLRQTISFGRQPEPT